MAKCILLKVKPTQWRNGQIPEPEVHYGYLCEVIDGQVIADIPDAMLPHELKAGRARLMEPEP